MSATRFIRIWENMGIGRGDVLFIHSSMNWIGGGIAEAVTIIESLMTQVGSEGTICMPSYTWRGVPNWQPGDAVVDLRRNPTAVGLLPEIFRRWPGVVRSTSYWFPVCAWGSRAVELTTGQAAIIYPFGPGSTFRNVMEAGGKLVGLGVSLNTSSLAHLPDHDLVDICPVRVMSDNLSNGTVIDTNGTVHLTRIYGVHTEFVATYRPSVLFEHDAALKRNLIFLSINGAHYFCYRADEFYRAGVEVGRAFLARGRLPPWLGGQSTAPER